MRKYIICFLLSLVLVSTVSAAPMRVVMMDFTDESGGSLDAQLGGGVSSELLANKGVYAVGKQLMGNPDVVLIDRRDFMKQMDRMRLNDGGKPTEIKPSYIQAAQALNADAVLRGVLESFSVGKEKIKQGGYNVDFSTVTVRVMLQAVDAVDGSVLAMSEGVAQERFRQTEAKQTILGADDVLQLMQQAVAGAVPELEQSLATRMEANQERGKVMLAMTATENPAMVEIDGVLVGTTPAENMEVYKGDHVLTVSRPGYQTITKRIVMNGNMRIDVPMLRTDLTAEEKKQVLEGVDMRMYINEGGQPDFVIQTID